ncbi:PREDICTED: C-C chemokine receptor type 6-like [Cyprinodon variegatus]|uniref:C-C chemokine receptor type 6-like n=1 Tax=Cyprinodon variegatus TaxID=28743 RepID=UPI0007429DB2|nr:PREDICTED: C-C chemokine receptor type 6-like [Cyprinodon variegatus]XP_015252821.1 PREDICTED: C-C chemokine receptor type 6-like [Cyprinodon variegatus]
MGASESTTFGPCYYKMSTEVDKYLYKYILPIICILGLVGNCLVTFTLAVGKKKMSRSDFLLLNLAITNLLFVVVLLILSFHEQVEWLKGGVACKLLKGSYSINQYCGMLLLAWISLEHGMVVVNNNLKTPSKSLKFSFTGCAFIWVFSILVSIPAFLFYTSYDSKPKIIWKNKTKDKETSSPSDFICGLNFEGSNSPNLTRLAIPSVQMAVGFFLPLLVIISSYTLIIHHLQKEKLSQTVKNGLKNKATKRAIYVMVLFVVCHMPYNLILLYDTITMSDERECKAADGLQTALSVAQAVTCLQCCLNPVVYNFMGENFRKKFQKCCSAKGKRKYDSAKRSSRFPGTEQFSMKTIKESKEFLDT